VCSCPFAKPIGVDSADHHTVALQHAAGAPSGPATYTTSGDVTMASTGSGAIQAVQVVEELYAAWRVTVGG
jgi:hypothetical protein